MLHLTRQAAVLVFAFCLLVSGCEKAENPKTQAKATAEPKAEAKAAAKPAPEVKPATPDAKNTAKEEEAKEEAELKANLAKLSPEDRKLAEAQRFCAINTDERLGSPSMGTPIKVMLKGKPVFLCCGGCRKQALAEPDQTLAKAEELKAKSAATTK